MLKIIKKYNFKKLIKFIYVKNINNNVLYLRYNNDITLSIKNNLHNNILFFNFANKDNFDIFLSKYLRKEKLNKLNKP